MDTDSYLEGRSVPLVALLVAPVLVCFVGGVVAAAARPAPAPAAPPE